MLSVSGSCLNNPLMTDLKLIANSGLSNHKNRPKLTEINQKGGSYYQNRGRFYDIIKNIEIGISLPKRNHYDENMNNESKTCSNEVKHHNCQNDIYMFTLISNSIIININY